MENIVLDTDILIDFLRNKKETVLFLEGIRSENLATTAINAFELFWGAYKAKSQLVAVERLLNSILLLNTTKKSVRESGRIAATLDSQGIQINVGDLLIAAICKVNDYAIATGKKKHFERIEGLEIWST
ncbi:MAG: type II toxin-antitoxin system VapC family toxin [Candidatus Methanofastidiosia archaeon]|jgi:predicted nucleic acid-binding protein